VARVPSPATARSDGKVVQAAIRQPEPLPASQATQSQPDAKESVPVADSSPTHPPAAGTVVLDVEQGGLEVPSFVGKTVRGAVETAQDAGLELEAVGSGLARQQSPPAGTHVIAGAHVIVQFGR